MSRINPIPPRAPALHRRGRDTLVLAVLFALVIGGLAGLAAATGWAETRAQVARLTVWQIVVILALSLVNYAARGFRWHLFAQRIGLGTSLVDDYRHFLGGFAMSVTPGRLGELVRMRWIGRETGRPFETTAPLMLVDRASDLAAVGLLLGLALSASASGIAFGLPVVGLVLAAALVATRPALLLGLAALGHRITGRFDRVFAKVRRAAHTLAAFSAPRLLAVAGGLGLVGWLAEGYAFALLLGWMGAEVHTAKAVAIFLFSGIAGGLSGAPGGVGGAEATMVALLALEGVGLEAAIPATAIIRVSTLWFAILIGLAVFPLAEKHSLRNAHAVERD